MGNVGQGRALGGQALNKGFDVVKRTFEKDGNTAGSVGHLALEMQCRCQLINKGPEADTLNNSLDAELSCFLAERSICML